MTTHSTGRYYTIMQGSETTASGNCRSRILMAAFEQFYRNGFQGGSLSQIVEKAGTTKGALFHHFDGKNDLGYAVVEEVILPKLSRVGLTRWLNWSTRLPI